MFSGASTTGHMRAAGVGARVGVGPALGLDGESLVLFTCPAGARSVGLEIGTPPAAIQEWGSMADLWTKKYFDTIYLRRWNLGPPGPPEYEHVDFIARQLPAVHADTLLDVGCGQGRYSLAFAKRGFHVTGLDSSASLLKEARRLALRVGCRIDWILGDMRALPLLPRYRLAILFDSLGFFDTEEEDNAVFHEMARVIRPDGWLVFVVVNGQRILNAFEPQDQQEADGRSIVVQRAFDPVRRIISEVVTIRDGHATYSAERRQRLYGVSELTEAAARGGRIVHSLFGGLTGQPFDQATSAKVVMFCRNRTTAHFD